MRRFRVVFPALIIVTLTAVLATPALAASPRTIKADYKASNAPGGVDDNRCSLVEAITEAQTPGTFSGGNNGLLNECKPTGTLAPTTIKLTAIKSYLLTTANNGTTGDFNGLPVITTPLVIEGDKGSVVWNNSATADSFRFFDVQSGGDLTLISTDYLGRPATSGYPDDGGAMIVRAGGAAHLDSVIFEQNRAANRGGAVANFGTVTVTNYSTLRFNRSIGPAGIGGVFYNAATLDIGGETDIRNNRSTLDGGAIYNDTTGDLTFDDESQLYGNHINTDASKGAGLYNAGDATVDTAIISKNKGNDSSVHIAGGGIYNTAAGTMSITNSIFLYNETNGVETASALTSFTGNCLYIGGADGYSGGVSFKDTSGLNQSVDGNWWGIASGPGTVNPPPATVPLLSAGGDSPSGTANSDSPTSWLKDPAPGCPLTTLTKNPSLEPAHPGGTTAPSWKRVRMTSADKTDCGAAFLDDCAFMVSGNGSDKMLSQTIKLTGPDEYYFGLMVSSKALNVPVGATYRALVTIYYNKDHTSDTYAIEFSTGTHDWEHGAAYFASTINTTHDTFNNLKVVLEYSAASGTVWFDDVRLIYCPYP